MGFSVGIGLTNDCNLACEHCYRDTEHISQLSLEQVQRLCDSIQVASMGLGTGENGLHPQFVPIIEYLRERNIRLSMASNGYSLTTIPDETLSAFKDVEVSIDFPTPAEQDNWRGAGNWELVHRAIDRCHQHGIEVSILATLMKPNFDKMGAMIHLARRDKVNLRVNVYQAVKSEAFRLKYEEFWEGFRRLFAEGKVITCGEPVVRAVMGLDNVQSPCGRGSIRINPRGQVIPCVYWPSDSGTPLTLEDLHRLGNRITAEDWFHQAREIPAQAENCPCRGGCASRRALNNKLDAHDDYCPWSRGDEIQLTWQPAPAKDLMRAGNVCTTIVC